MAFQRSECDHASLRSKSNVTRSIRKCTKFVTGKKSAVGDKPAVKRQEKPISWVRLHFATVPILTREDMDVQIARVSMLPRSHIFNINLMDCSLPVLGGLE